LFGYLEDDFIMKIFSKSSVNQNLFLFLFVFFCSKGISQNTYYKNFNAGFSPYQIIIAPDSSYIGVSGSPSGQYAYIYNFNQSGNLLWVKEASFPTIIFPTKIIALYDSSIAILLHDFTNPMYDLLLKADLNGNIIWTRSLTIGSPVLFSSMAPTTDGGIMLSGGGCAGSNMLLHFSPSGSLVSQNAHLLTSIYQNIGILDMIHEGSNLFSYKARANNLTSDQTAVFFRSDSAGNINSYKELHYPPSSSKTIDASTSSKNGLAKSISGEHYLSFHMYDSLDNKHKAILTYLDQQDEPVWSKIISSDSGFWFLDLETTLDGGCVIGGYTVETINPTHTYSPCIIKFDVNGNILFSKKGGNIFPLQINRSYLSSFKSANDGGLCGLVNRSGYFDVCKFDSSLNGFCVNNILIPSLSNYIPTTVSFSVSKNPLLFSVDTLNISSIPLNVTSSLLCFTDIQENNDSINFFISQSSTGNLVDINYLMPPSQVGLLEVYNVGGQKMIEKLLPGGTTSITINTNSLVEGIYICKLSFSHLSSVRKFVIHK